MGRLPLQPGIAIPPGEGLELIEGNLTDDTPLQHLLQQLQQYSPHTLLVASANTPPAIEEYARENGCELTSVAPDEFDRVSLGRYEFAVVADYLEHLDKPKAMAHLGRLRNLHSQRIWLLVDDDGTWHFHDFIGLGFQRQHSWHQNGRRLICYGYDLASYNHVRAWNNPRFWANPENWNKYWW